jgi:GT2 family glycosyltransferase
MKNLAELFLAPKKYYSDKWSNYIEVYENIFKSKRDVAISILEIGVQNGGSLEVWANYFQRGLNFIGCDIDPKCEKLSFTDERIKVIIGDVNDEYVYSRIKSLNLGFDFIIDDGSHRSPDIIKSFFKYFDLLSEDGIYIVEDLHCSYWEEYQGGLYHPRSATSFFKSLIDVINQEHWRIDKSRKEFINYAERSFGVEISELSLQKIHSLEFHNSMCIVKKKNEAYNILLEKVPNTGLQVIVKNSNTRPGNPSQKDNFWSKLDSSPLEIYESHLHQIKHLESINQERAIQLQKFKEVQIQFEFLKLKLNTLNQIYTNLEDKNKSLEVEISNIKSSLNQVLTSRSWRLTACYRSCGALFKKIIYKIKYIFYKFKKIYLIITSKNIYEIDIFVNEIINNNNAINKLSIKYSISEKLLYKIIKFYKTTLFFFKYINRNLNYLNIRSDYFIEKTMNVIFGVFYKVNNEDINELNWHIKNMPIKPHFFIIHDNLKINLNQFYNEYTTIYSLNYNKTVKKLIKDHEEDIFIILLNGGESLANTALYEFASRLNSEPNLDLIYADSCYYFHNLKLFHDKKPPWSPDYLEARNYIGFPFCVRLNKNLTFNFNGRYDLLLKFTEERRSIEHIPKLLGFKALSTLFSRQENNEIKALFGRLKRTGRVNCSIEPHSKNKMEYIIQYPNTNSPLVSIVIPTAGKYYDNKFLNISMVENLVLDLRKKITYKNIEIIVSVNSDISGDILSFLKLKSCKIVKYIDKDFNLSRKINSAANYATGEFLIILNDDIQIISPNWIESMLGHFTKKHVGIVGAKLLYPNLRIQHAGVAHINGGPFHFHRFKSRNAYSKQKFSATGTRNHVAVTGACLMIRREIFLQVGGYGENLKTNFNDVDLCLKVSKIRLTTVYCPQAELIHYESKSDLRSSPNDLINYRKYWADQIILDQYYYRRIYLKDGHEI